jgi:hypothetical protein
VQRSTGFPLAEGYGPGGRGVYYDLMATWDTNENRICEKV